MGFFSSLFGGNKHKPTKEQLEEQARYRVELYEYINKYYGVPRIRTTTNYEVFISMSIRKIATCENNYTFHDYDFDSIVGAYVEVDDEIIMKTSGGIGRAIVGGLIAGSVGAVVGYATTPITEKRLIKFARLTILTNDPQQQIINIPLIGGFQKHYSTDHDVRHALNQAEAFVKIINQIVVGG